MSEFTIADIYDAIRGDLSVLDLSHYAEGLRITEADMAQLQRLTRVPPPEPRYVPAGQPHTPGPARLFGIPLFVDEGAPPLLDQLRSVGP